MFLSKERLRKKLKNLTGAGSNIKLVPIAQQRSTTLLETVSKRVTESVQLIDYFKEESNQNVLQKIPSASSVSTSINSRISNVSVIELHLTKVVCSNVRSSLLSLSEIEDILLSEDRHQLEDLVDYFVLQLVNQLIVLEQCEHPLVLNCYYKIFELFAELYLYPELICRMTEGAIKRAIDQFVLLSTDEKFDIFLNCLDCLLCTVLEFSEYSLTTCALLKSLFGTVQDPPTPSKFQAGIVKCLWKMITLISSCDVDKLDYESIFSDIHAFFSDYPTHWWQKQPSDLPLTTVNTLLHVLVKLKPGHSKSCLKLLKGVTSESEISYYCNKITRCIEQDDVSDAHEDDNQQSKQIRDELSTILEKIESPNKSREGLQLLYNFKQRHPEANIDLFLNELTHFLKSYIHRGLHSIELEQRCTPDKSHFEHKSNNVPHKKRTSQGKMSNTSEVQNLLKRLRILQEEAGLCMKPTES